ncbi:MAG: hypothetical protein R2712_28340 [Vicinamibacterales bacterium]
MLKRLEDAERDGDRVYAVLRSVEGSSDGRAMGLTAPRPAGQRRAVDRAYARAGVSPATIGLYEAHGTGTVVGDRAELETIVTAPAMRARARAGAPSDPRRSSSGHTKAAAGMVGLMKEGGARTAPPHDPAARRR